MIFCRSKTDNLLPLKLNMTSHEASGSKRNICFENLIWVRWGSIIFTLLLMHKNMYHLQRKNRMTVSPRTRKFFETLCGIFLPMGAGSTHTYFPLPAIPVKYCIPFSLCCFEQITISFLDKLIWNVQLGHVKQWVGEIVLFHNFLRSGGKFLFLFFQNLFSLLPFV